MARTIMISNELYEELKNLKRDKSFTELLKDLLKSSDIKRGSNLRSFLGIIKKDDEWDKAEKIIKRGWKKWNKKYV